MSVSEQLKLPLRKLKTRLRESLFEHAGYYVKHNVTDAEIETSGEAFLISLCGRTWERCLDVGANRGDYARAVLTVNPACEVVCFEPNPALADFLEKEVLSPHPQCRVVPSLVGDVTGEATFHLHPDRPAHSSMYNPTPQTQTLRLPQITLDDYCRDHQITDIDCVKVDVEGHEYAVLQGMSRLISEERVGMIQFEYGMFSHKAGTSFRQLYDLLSPNFRLCHLMSGGLLPAVYRPNIEKFDFSNWVAFSRKRFG